MREELEPRDGDVLTLISPNVLLYSHPCLLWRSSRSRRGWYIHTCRSLFASLRTSSLGCALCLLRIARQLGLANSSSIPAPVTPTWSARRSAFVMLFCDGCAVFPSASAAVSCCVDIGAGRSAHTASQVDHRMIYLRLWVPAHSFSACWARTHRPMSGVERSCLSPS